MLAYTGGGDATEFYAGSFAKLIVVAAAQGVDPTAFGTGPRKDLVANLRALECGTHTRTDCPAGTAGRFSDRSQFGDFSNPITQSLAVIALERATRRGASRNAVSYLLGAAVRERRLPGDVRYDGVRAVRRRHRVRGAGAHAAQHAQGGRRRSGSRSLAQAAPARQRVVHRQRHPQREHHRRSRPRR